MENWFIFAVLSGLFSSVFNLLFRFTLKSNNDTVSFSWWFETLRVLLFLLVLPFDFWIDLNLKTFILLLSLGLVEFVSIYFYSKMHASNELSISTLIVRLRVVWVPILALLFTNESLSTEAYIGIFIIFAGLLFVSGPKKIMKDKGILIALLCSFITSILAIISKLVSGHASPSLITIFMSFPSVVLFPFLVKDWKNKALSFYLKSSKMIFWVAIASVSTMYFQIRALSLGSVSEVMGVFQAMSLFAVFAGIFFLNEKENMWEKIIGSFIVTLGVLLVV